jgi:hypothetical protein
MQVTYLNRSTKSDNDSSKVPPFMYNYVQVLSAGRARVRRYVAVAVGYVHGRMLCNFLCCIGVCEYAGALLILLRGSYYA